MIPLKYDTILSYGGVFQKMSSLDTNTKIAYHEKKKHSDDMFAFNIYPCTIPLDFSFVPLHWQDDVEIIYVKKGIGEVRVDSEVYRAKAGDVFIVLPGHIHGINSVLGEKMEYENIFFDLELLDINNIDWCNRKYIYPIIEGRMMIPTYIYAEHELYHSFIGCLDYIDRLSGERIEGYEIGVKGMLLTALSVLWRCAVETTEFEANSSNNDKIKLVLRRIETDYARQLTIEDMANECGYSASHFMRWFKENTGFSFNNYLIEYRLNRAAEELRKDENTILNIANDVGFDNLSNFNRLFKKRFLMTPSEFRKECLGS